MPLAPTVRETFIAAVPGLRAFAISLAGNVERADDLVQETLLRAIAHIGTLAPGTNMPAWLFTILRDLFRSEYRKHRREIQDGEGAAEGAHAQRPKSPAEQTCRMELREFGAAFATLPPEQRAALTLVGALGFSYEEAAAICDCAVGTIKSRVNRARIRLASLLAIETTEGVEDDHDTRMSAAAGAGG